MAVLDLNRRHKPLDPFFLLGKRIQDRAVSEGGDLDSRACGLEGLQAHCLLSERGVHGGQLFAFRIMEVGSGEKSQKKSVMMLDSICYSFTLCIIWNDIVNTPSLTAGHSVEFLASCLSSFYKQTYRLMTLLF